jgi:hypothetical protein
VSRGSGFTTAPPRRHTDDQLTGTVSDGVEDLRHSKLSITVDTYGHLMPYATQQAVDAIADALAAAELSRSDA